MKSQPNVWPWISLFIAGLGWGTAGPLIRTLAEYNLGTFLILLTRLFIVGIVFLSIVWAAKNNKRTVNEVRMNCAVLGLGMVVYYVSAIIAFRELPLSIAVVFIGSSPILGVLYEFVQSGFSQVAPSSTKVTRGGWRQSLGLKLIELTGPLVAISSLICFFQAHEASKTSSQHGTSIVGLIAALICSAMAVANARFMRSLRPEDRPTPAMVSLWTAGLGLPIAVVAVLIKSELNQVDWNRIQDNFTVVATVIVALGLIATVIPGWAIAYASKSLPPVATATSSVQLQIWTIVIGVVGFNEPMPGPKILAFTGIIVGLAMTLVTQAQINKTPQ